MSFVFVYGTLRRGGSNDITGWLPRARYVGDARVEGALYDLGAYPGIRLDERGTVRGEVFEISAELESRLDVLEDVRDDGSGEYLKRYVELALARGPTFCLVYEIQRRHVAHRPRIAGGDWLAHRV